VRLFDEEQLICKREKPYVKRQYV